MTTNEMPEQIWAGRCNRHFQIWRDSEKAAIPLYRTKYTRSDLLTAKDAEIEKLGGENSGLRSSCEHLQKAYDSYVKACANLDAENVELRVAVRELCDALDQCANDGYATNDSYNTLEKHKHLLNEQAKGE